jgi:hypothetical protein
MTLPEVQHAIGGYLESIGAAMAEDAITRQDLAALMAHYPDGPQ